MGLAFLLGHLWACSKEPTVQFEVETVNGQFKTSEHAERIVYVDFWATWCAPCRASFPWMNEMIDKYQDEGLHIIAVSIDADKALAKKFATDMEARFEIGFDSAGDVANLFEVRVMPTSVILGAGGSVLDQHQGFNEAKKAEYEQAIVAALKTLK